MYREKYISTSLNILNYDKVITPASAFVAQTAFQDFIVVITPLRFALFLASSDRVIAPPTATLTTLSDAGLTT